MHITQVISRKFFVLGFALSIAIAMFGFFALALPTSADVDPASCVDTGGAISLGAFRSDGVTSIGAADKALDGEMIKYKATLSAAPFPPNCAFEGGTWTLTTPNGTVHPLGAVPRIGGIGVASHASGLIDYTVLHANEVTFIITATTAYSGGTSHADVGDTTPGPTLGTSKLITVIHPTTVTTINSSSATVVSSGTVTLTVTEHNDGDIDLTNPHVIVDQGIGTLDETSLSFTGVDGGDVGILDPGETWTWVLMSPAIVADMTFTATGYGTDPLLNDVTFPDDQDEQDSVLVEVVTPLVVEKTAQTSYDRDWDWNIVKSADKTDLILNDGESPFDVNYTVMVSAVSTNVNHTVTGTITVTNPAGNPDVDVIDIDDVLDNSGDATTLSCEDENADITFPFTLSEGEVLTCDYTKTGASEDDTLNTVTVTTDGSVPGGDATADVDWEEPVNEIDECVDVSDDNVNAGVLGQVCAGDGDNDETFNYSVSFGAHPDADVILECGVHEHPNIASYVVVDDANDTGENDDADWNVTITIDCFEGCTLTQGYWKTHSSHGPAPEDDSGAWDEVGGPDADFFLSGVSWLNVFKTPPGGNPYYQLAHQYMATVLNTETDASVPDEVQDAINGAKILFETFTPAQIGKGKTAKQYRTEFTSLAGILGSYNEGLIGPGHCDEQNPI